MINIQSTLRAVPDFNKNVSLAVLLGSNGNSYTISKQSDMCMYTHVLHNIERLVAQKKSKYRESSECRVP
jgi:transcriptional regulatory protein LevR